ncbi:MAG: phosphatase PAP2 family protein [Dehalococcoidia bacterium]|nr:phosphatase PAP2 family protein [Dehalococcoidia bacterium]
MEALQSIDKEIVLWLNQWAGRYALLDKVERLIVSDYFIPVLAALFLVFVWFAGRDARQRDAHQRAVLRALIAVGFANLTVLILNQHYFRERPFVEYELTLLFYPPTDSSFPANPAAVTFAMASGMWQGSRKLGAFLYGLAALWGLSRIYAGVFYPSDVVAGALIGVAISYLVAVGLRLIEPLPTLVLRGARTLHLA